MLRSIRRSRLREGTGVLIGIPPILGPEMLFTLRYMGHGDEIALVDGNYPAQEHGRRLIRADGHGVLVLLEAVLTLLPLDRAVPAAAFRAALNNDPAQQGEIHRQIDALVARMVPGIIVTPLSGADLYPRIRACHTLVATSETALFANVILRKGVISASGPG
jgi:L-fucose mutarotase